MIHETFPVGALGCNCSIVACPETKQALIVDPGDEAPRITAALARLGVTAVYIVHTHAHFDHVLATGALATASGAETALHEDDRWLWDNVPTQLALFGFPNPEAAATTAPNRWLQGGEELRFGRRSARALHTPGHTPGSTCYFVEPPSGPPLLFSGDTLFAGSIGRTDLWGGSFEAITRSIRGTLFDLPENTVVIPGHGLTTTVGDEKLQNPFVGSQR